MNKRLLFVFLALALARLAQPLPAAVDEDINALYFRNVTAGELRAEFPVSDERLLENLKSFVERSDRSDVWGDYLRLKAVRSGLDSVLPDLDRFIERNRFSEAAFLTAADFLLRHRAGRLAAGMYQRLIERHPQAVRYYANVIAIARDQLFPADELKGLILDFCRRAESDYPLRLNALIDLFDNGFVAEGFAELTRSSEKYPERLGQTFTDTLAALKRCVPPERISQYWLPRLDPFRHAAELVKVFDFLRSEHQLDAFIERQRKSPQAEAYQLIYFHVNDQEQKVETLVNGLTKAPNLKEWAGLLRNLDYDRASLTLYLMALNRTLEPDTLEAVIELLADGHFVTDRLEISNLKSIFSFDANLSFFNGLLSLAANSTRFMNAIEAVERQYYLLLNFSYIQRLLALMEKSFPAYQRLPALKLRLADYYLTANQPALALRFLETLNGRDVAVLRSKLKAYQALRSDARIEETYRQLLQLDASGRLEWLSAYADFLKRQRQFIRVIELFKGEIARHPQDKEVYLKYIAHLEGTNQFSELESAYQTTARAFSDSSFYGKLARFYLNKKKKLQFQELCLRLAGELGQGEMAAFLDEFLQYSVVDFRSLDYEFRLNVYRQVLKRFPTDAVLARRLLEWLEKDTAKNEAEIRQLVWKYYLLDSGVRDRMFALFNRQATSGGADAAAQQAAQGDELFRDSFLAFFYFNRTDYERSLERLDRIKGAFFANAAIWKGVARLCASFAVNDASRLEPALQAFAALRRIDPADSGNWEEAGNQLAYAGRYGEAERLWSELVASEPGNVAHYLKLAFLHKSFFQVGQALETVRRGERVAPKNKDLLLLKALLLEETGETWNSLLSFFDCIQNLDLYDELQYKIETHLLDIVKKDEGLFERALADYVSRTAPGRLASFIFRFLQNSGRENQMLAMLQPIIPRMSDIGALEALEESAAGDGISFMVREAVLRRLLELDPLYPNYYSRLAGAYESDGRDRQADEVYRRALTAFRDSFRFESAFREYLDFLWRSKNFASGFGLIREHLGALSGRQKQALLAEMADKYMEMGAFAEAREILWQLMREPGALEGSDDIPFKYLTVLESLGDPRGVTEALNMSGDRIRSGVDGLEAKNLRLFELYRRGAMTLARLGMKEKAVDYLIEAVNRQPVNREFLRWTFFKAREMALENRILDYYRKLAATSSSDYRWTLVLARLQQLAGDGAQALTLLQKAQQIEPHLEFLYDELFKAYYAQNRRAEALEILKKQLAITENKAEVLLRFGDALLRAGRDGELGGVLAQLIQISPYFSTYTSIMKLLAEQGKNVSLLEYADRFWNEVRKRYRREYLPAEFFEQYTVAYMRGDRLEDAFERLKSLDGDMTRENKANWQQILSGNVSVLEGFLRDTLPDLVRRQAAASSITRFRQKLAADLYGLSQFSFAEDMLQNLRFLGELASLKSYYFNYYLNNLDQYSYNVSQYLEFFRGFYFRRGDFAGFRDYMVNYEHFRKTDARDFYVTALEALKLSGSDALYGEYLDEYVRSFVLTQKAAADRGAFAAVNEFLRAFLDRAREKALADKLSLVGQRPFYYRGMALNYFAAHALFDDARQAVRAAFPDKPEEWRQAKLFLIDLFDRGRSRPVDESLRRSVVQDQEIAELLRDTSVKLTPADRLKLSFIAYRLSGDQRLLYSLTEKSPLTAEEYERTADALSEAKEYAAAEAYYRNALYLEFGKDLMAKTALSLFRQGKKEEAVQMANRIALRNGDDARILIECLQAIGALDSGWDKVSAYLSHPDFQKRSDFPLALKLAFAAYGDRALNLFKELSRRDDKTLNLLLGERWFSARRGELFPLFIAAAERFTGQRRAEIFADIAAFHMGRAEVDAAKTALDRVFALQKTPPDSVWRLRLEVILKKNAPADLERFFADVLARDPESNLSESLLPVFQQGGREKDYYRLQEKKYATLVKMAAGPTDRNYLQWIAATLKLGNTARAYELCNDLLAQFGYDAQLLLDAVETFLKADEVKQPAFLGDLLHELDASGRREQVLYLRSLLIIRTVADRSEARRLLLEALKTSADSQLNEKIYYLYAKYFGATDSADVQADRDHFRNFYPLLCHLFLKKGDGAAIRQLFDEYTEKGFVQELPRAIIERLTPEQLARWPAVNPPTEVGLRLFVHFWKRGQGDRDRARAVLEFLPLRFDEYGNEEESTETSRQLSDLALAPAAVQEFLRSYFDLAIADGKLAAGRRLLALLREWRAPGLEACERQLAATKEKQERVYISEDIANAGGDL